MTKPCPSPRLSQRTSVARERGDVIALATSLCKQGSTFDWTRIIRPLSVDAERIHSSQLPVVCERCQRWPNTKTTRRMKLDSSVMGRAAAVARSAQVPPETCNGGGGMTETHTDQNQAEDVERPIGVEARRPCQAAEQAQSNEDRHDRDGVGPLLMHLIPPAPGAHRVHRYRPWIQCSARIAST